MPSRPNRPMLLHMPFHRCGNTPRRCMFHPQGLGLQLQQYARLGRTNMEHGSDAVYPDRQKTSMDRTIPRKERNVSAPAHHVKNHVMKGFQRSPAIKVSRLQPNADVYCCKLLAVLILRNYQRRRVLPAPRPSLLSLQPWPRSRGRARRATKAAHALSPRFLRPRRSCCAAASFCRHLAHC